MAEPPEKGRLPEPTPLSDNELLEVTGEELPDREVMSLLDANIAIPVNAAVAANVLSDDAGAFAVSDQDMDIDQVT